MAFGFVILVGIGILVLSFAAFGYYGIPVGIVLAAVFAGFVLRLASKKGDSPGGGSESSRAQDSAGGPAHQAEGYAHTGQAHMTPDQMKRAR